MFRIVPLGDNHIFLRLNSFTRGDRSTLDPDRVLLDCIGSVDGDLIIGRIARGNAQIVVLKINVEVRQDQLLFDLVPDDPL